MTVELMDEARLQALAQRYGSFYLYDGEIISQHTAQLVNDFEGGQFYGNSKKCGICEKDVVFREKIW